MSSPATLGVWWSISASCLSSSHGDWQDVNSELCCDCCLDATASESLWSSLSMSTGFCPDSGLSNDDTETCEFLSRFFLWKKEEMPEEGLAAPILEWEKLLEEDTGELISVSVSDPLSWVEGGGTSLAPTTSSSSSACFRTCFCFSAALWKKDWMVPGCLHGEPFFSSERGWIEDWEGEKTLCDEVTSLQRKPAIPPADGASLNLLAERCSRVKGGVLGIWCKTERLNHTAFLSPVLNASHSVIAL